MIFPDKKLLVICNTLRGRRVKFYAVQRCLFADVRILARQNYSNIEAHSWKKLDDIQLQVKQYRPDIIHVCFDNSQSARFVINLGLPVVLDCHDHSVIRGVSDPDAKFVFSSSCPIIFPCKSIADYIAEHYDTDEALNVVIPSAAPLYWRAKNLKCKRKSRKRTLVYCGSTVQNFGYRAYGRLFDLFQAHGIEVHVYPAYPSKAFVNVNTHQTIQDHCQLYQELSQYDVGFVGYDRLFINQRDLKYAHIGLPNKVFDYLMSGTPILSLDIGSASEYINKFGMNVPYQAKQDMDKLLLKNYDSVYQLNINFDYWQQKYCLDNYVRKLEEIYQESLQCNG